MHIPLLLLALLSPLLPATVTFRDDRVEAAYEESRQVKARSSGNTYRDAVLIGAAGFAAGFCLFKTARVLRCQKTAAATAVSLLLISPFSTNTASACLNVEDMTLEEAYADQEDDSWFVGTVHNAMQAEPATHPLMTPNPQAYPSPPPQAVLDCDAAARMILGGDADGALTLLKKVEATHPGLYNAAANMGTAYELTGNDEKALEWIKEGIRRKPDSHMKAEWLHVRILEAKIALKKDPAWLESNAITGFEPLNDFDYETLQGIKSAYGILESMRSQATVRALFIKPQDPVMAHLLKEAAQFAMVADLKSVPGALDLAVAYGLPEAAASPLRDAFREAFRARRLNMLERGTKMPGAAWLYEYRHWLIFACCAVLGAAAAAGKIPFLPRRRPQHRA